MSQYASVINGPKADHSIVKGVVGRADGLRVPRGPLQKRDADGSEPNYLPERGDEAPTSASEETSGISHRRRGGLLAAHLHD